MTTTAHRHFEALTFAQSIAPNAPILGIPDTGTALNSVEEVLVVEQCGQTRRVCQEDWEQWEWTLGAPIPFDTPGTLVVSYMYRDAANYKQFRDTTIAGPFSRADLALLIGALCSGDDRSFIPHQIGLFDLQEDANFDDDGDDHVWHTFERLDWKPEKRADHTWAELRPVVRDRLEKGYDMIAAINHLDGGW